MNATEASYCPDRDSNNDHLSGLLCPHCGLLFFAAAVGVMRLCPGCGRRFKVRSEALLEAKLTNLATE